MKIPIHARQPLLISARNMSIELSEILGYLASEGSDYDRIDDHLGFDKRRNKAYRRHIKRTIIEFSNTDKALQKHLTELMKNVFGYTPNFSKNGSLKINRVEVVKFLREFSRFGSWRWNVPRQVTTSSNEIKAAFCRAFADGDGTIEQKKKEIRIDSTNKKGLRNLKRLLSDLKINSLFYDFGSRHRIVVRDLEHFDKIIGFNHPEKKKKVRELLGSS